MNSLTCYPSTSIELTHESQVDLGDPDELNKQVIDYLATGQVRYSLIDRKEVPWLI